jgi:hypothetical protein
MNPLIQFKPTTLPLLIVCVLVCFGLSPTARAQLPSPSPDGGYTEGNTAEGDRALSSLTINVLEDFGIDNTAIGEGALHSNTTGSGNTAVGGDLDEKGALFSNTTGYANTAVGAVALVHNTIGTKNTADGLDALFNLRSGDGNIALGCDAALNLFTGSNNIYVGSTTAFNESNTIRIGNADATTYFDGTSHPAQTAAYIAGIYGVTVAQGSVVFVDANGHLGTTNTTGFDNTAIGNAALVSNTTGDENTATGVDALSFNTTGTANTANGVQALQDNTTGSSNTADGLGALFHNTTGAGNIALGTNAGFNLTTGNNNIDVGNLGVAGEANTIRIGTQGTQTATYIAGISGTPLTGGVVVRVNAKGQLGTVVSSVRFKQNIKPMDKASEAILALKPVSFRYKKEIDPEGSPQFGLVAEQVEKVNPDLVVRDADGKPYTVRYDAVNAMLLNEFLKEHKTVQEQGATIAELKKQIATLVATAKEQAAQIQKVSAQLEVSKPAPQTIVNNP